MNEQDKDVYSNVPPSRIFVFVDLGNPPKFQCICALMHDLIYFSDRIILISRQFCGMKVNDELKIAFSLLSNTKLSSYYLSNCYNFVLAIAWSVPSS